MKKDLVFLTHSVYMYVYDMFIL